jgi:hypothetical protein
VVEDLTEAKFVYLLPISKEELADYLRNETIFKKMPKLKSQMLTKHFFPHQAAGKVEHDDDSEDSEEGTSPVN